MECEHCQRKGGLYDLANLCCKVRLLMSLHTRNYRAAMLAKWRQTMGDAVADEVQQAVLARWER